MSSAELALRVEKVKMSQNVNSNETLPNVSKTIQGIPITVYQALMCDVTGTVDGIHVYEPQRQETYLWTCAPSEDSDQPAHSRSVIRIFPVRNWDSQGYKLSSGGKRRLIRLRGCAG